MSITAFILGGKLIAFPAMANLNTLNFKSYILCLGLLGALLMTSLDLSAREMGLKDSLDRIIGQSPSASEALHHYSEWSWTYRQSQPELAFFLAKEGLGLARSESNKKYEVKLLGRLASVSYSQKQHAQAILYLDSALLIAHQREDSLSMAGIYFNLSLNHAYLGEYPKALKSASEALDLYKGLKQEKGVALSYRRIAEVYESSGRIGAALRAYRKALSLNLVSQDSLQIINQFQSIGSLLTRKAQKEGKDLQPGIDSLQLALRLALDKEAFPYLPNIYTNLGLAYARGGSCESAVQFYQRGLEYFPYLGVGNDLLPLNLGENYARCLLELGRMDEAKQLIDSTLVMALEEKNASDLLGVYESMSEILEAKGDYSAALAYQKRYTDLAAILGQRSHSKEMEALELRLRVDSRIEAAELKAENARIREEKSRMTIYALLAGLGLLIAGAWIAIQWLRRRQKLKENQLKTAARLEKQDLLDRLRKKELSSMGRVIEGQEIERRRLAAELHDGLGGILAALKMTFSSLQRKISAGKSVGPTLERSMGLLEDAVKTIRSLSHQMAARPLLHASLASAIRELAETLRESQDMDLNLEIEALDKLELNPEKQLHLYRIVQELFQNMVKHAKASQARLKVETRLTAFQLEFQDNGKGFAYREGEELPGLGLQNIRDRVGQMGGIWSLQTHHGKGFRIQIEIPLDQEYSPS